MKLLLINLPGESVRKPEEHCGLAFLKAYISQQGISAEIFDAYAKRRSMTEVKDFVHNWIKSNEAYKLYIGISPFVTSHDNFVELGTYIKEISAKTCVFAGGHYASLNKEYLIQHYNWLDAIIVGEGEISLHEMLVSSAEENIPGVFKRGYEKNFIRRRRIDDLDSLPFQDRYLDISDLEGQPFAITTSRGCYGECNFCSISSFYKLNDERKQTYRSAGSVSKEIHELVDKYGVNSIKIVDDNFFRDKSDTFLEQLVKLLSDISVTFRLSARPNDITEYRAVKLKQMGATVIGIGAESAHKESLKLFNKGIDISYSDKAIKYLNAQNITCLVNFIMFNPIIDINGVWENVHFVEAHADDSLFHRINSHLWIRATDPIVEDLVNYGLCERKGFPYIECQYKNKDIVKLREIFDIWCNHNMHKYYEYADVLMAVGINNNEEIYQKYRLMLHQDIEILKTLLSFCESGLLDTEGKKYVEACVEAENENIFD